MKCPTPITVKYTVAGVITEYTVPCGKCEVCLKNRQNSFAALAILEAKRSSSMHFLTLTYRNEVTPIAISDNTDAVRKFRFADKDNHAQCVEWCINSDRELKHVVVGDLEITPSLRREDVRLWLKSARVAWLRLGKVVPSFTYAAFGEYGTDTFRPHYHLVLFNSTDEFTAFLCSRWQASFGFIWSQRIPRVNRDGSNGFLKVSRYVSKYIAKPQVYFPFLVDGVAEKPRRFSSRGFGLNTIPVSSLKSFIYAPI